MFKKIVLFFGVLMLVSDSAHAIDRMKPERFSESSDTFSPRQVPKTIYTYKDEGVDFECLEHCELCFKNFYKKGEWQIKSIDAATLRETSWMQNAKVLVIGGGSATPYQNKLQGTGCKNIRDFVSDGGVYIGICAGAYFGADRVEFAKGTPDEICKDRELKFFPGTATGPVFGSFKPGSRAGACSAKVFTEDGNFFTYYNGGGTFLMDKEVADGIEILGRYRDGAPAIIKCRFGLGYAILSGVHLEFSPEKMEEDERQQEQAQDIADGYDDYCGGTFEFKKPSVMCGIIRDVMSTNTTRLLFLERIFANINAHYAKLKLD